MRRRERKPFTHYAVSRRLARAVTTDAAFMDRVRSVMVDQVSAWVQSTGHLVTGPPHWESIPESATETVLMRLTVDLVERTDGEWPAIRQALEEDERDRSHAQIEAAAAATAKKDADERRLRESLDRLKAEAAVWGARTPQEAREALGAPSAPRTRRM